MATIKDLLETHQVVHVGEDHRHGRAGWVQVDCPWCGKDSGKFHLGISLSNGAAACWRCGRKNTASVIALLTGMDSKLARKQVDSVALAAAPVRHTGKLVVPYGCEPMGQAHKAYLAARGLNAATVARVWGVRGIGLSTRLKWRLWIPIHHYGGIVSWTTRSIGPGGQRYLSAGVAEEALPHKHILYGGDYARNAITIHEGPLDVWAVGPGAVAVCGTAYTEAQLLAMTKFPVRAVCFDGERDAQLRARTLARLLSAYPGETHNVVLDSGKDPVEADRGEILELRRTFLD